MTQKHPSGQRLLRAAGIALALFACASPSVSAQETSVRSNDSMTVVRDAETGELRHATDAEIAALQAQSARSRARVAPQATQQKVHSSGARGARLTREFMSSSVAVRNADGKLEMQCFDAHGAADTAATAGHVHTTQAVTE